MSGDAQVIGGALLTIASAGAASPWVAGGLFAAGTALTYTGQRRLAKDAAREQRRKARERRDSEVIKSNVSGGAEHLMMAFGKRRVGGLIAHARQDSISPNIIHLAIIHSICHAGGCEGIDGIYINNDFISTSDMSGDPNAGEVNVTLAKYVVQSTNYMVKLRHYRGTDTQGDDSVLTATGGGASSDDRKKLAWTRVTLTRFATTTDDDPFQKAFPGGQIPVVGVRLKGVRVYDPRLDTTNGGSGSHRYTDTSTWRWTESSVDIGQNPILQAATWAIMAEDDGGLGLDPATEVNWTYVASEASKCEESIDIPGPSTQRRFMGNTVIFPEDDGRENMLKLLAPCAGDAVEEISTGKLKLFAGTYRSPTAEIDETWLRGSGERFDPRYSVDDIWNAVRVMHDSEDQGYNQVEAAGFTDAAYETQDGGERIWKELTVPGATNPYTAQYLAYIEGRKSRAAFLKLPCNLRAHGVSCGDTVTVNLDRMVDGDVYRIMQKTRDAGGPVLVLRREESSYYTVPSPFSTPVGTGASPAPTLVAPAIPTGVAAASADGGVRITWTDPKGSEAVRIEVHRATSSGGSFSKIADAIGFEYLDQTATSATFYYKLKAVSLFGQASAFSSEVSAASGSVKIAGSGARLGDERNGTALLGLNRQPAAITGASPLSAADVGATTTISIAAHTVQAGFGTISYNSGSITGLGFDTFYYVYADDPAQAGGAVTYAATTTPTNVMANSGRYYIDRILTPIDGGGPSGGGGGGGQFEP